MHMLGFGGCGFGGYRLEMHRRNKCMRIRTDTNAYTHIQAHTHTHTHTHTQIHANTQKRQMHTRTQMHTYTNAYPPKIYMAYLKQHQGKHM